MTREDIQRKRIIENNKEIHLTEEQIDVIEAINIDKKNVVIMAKAGSSKTSSLIFALTDRTSPHKNGLFLAYNNKIAKEIREKLGKNSKIDARTFHSIAYQYVVTAYGLKLVNSLNFKDISNRISYKEKYLFLKEFTNFCKSNSTNINSFFKNNIKFAQEAKDIMVKTLRGEISITFDITLKWFQILLHHKDVKPQEFDILIVDEANDVNNCMLDIFLKYPAKQKVMIGDQDQTINRWNGANGQMEIVLNRDDFVRLNLTGTMRCSPLLARNAEIFCTTNLRKDFHYIGNNTREPEYNTFIFLARTNAFLISEIAYLMGLDIKFNTARSVDSIFHLYLMIQFNAKKEYEYYLKHNKNSKNFKKEDIKYVKEYSKYVKDLAIREKHSLDPANQKYNDMYSKSLVISEKWLTEKYVSFAKWILLQDDFYEYDDLVRVAKVMIKLSKDNIDVYKAYRYAKDLEKSKEDYCLLLSSAHSAKGLTANIVYFADDMNSALKTEWKDNQKELKKGFIKADDEPALKNNTLKVDETNLYYMAFTRANYFTINAKLIKRRWYDNKQIQDSYEGEHLSYTDFIKFVEKRQKELKQNDNRGKTIFESL